MRSRAAVVGFCLAIGILSVAANAAVLTRVTPAATGASGAYALSFSPDGNFLYVADNGGANVKVYSRNSTTGVLSLVQTFSNGGSCPNNSLKQATGVVVSPDGNHVYASSAFKSALSVFSRNTAAGVAITGDGTSVYTAGVTNSAIGIFTRNTSTGALTANGVVQNAVGPVINMSGVTGVAVSADGAYVFGASATSNAINLFARST